jgi:ActR/RegA family two-component response regulator
MDSALARSEHARRVLIVTDDEEFRTLLPDLLRARGYQIAVTTSADILATEPAQVAPVSLLDLRGGWRQTSEKLVRKLSEHPGAMCIAITARIAVETAVSALRHGAYDYYDMLSAPADLYAILDRAFEKHRLLREREQAEQKLLEKNVLLDTALAHMSQGLCLFDAEARLAVCNNRYLEMYGFSPEVVKPGITLVDILRHRKDIGTFDGDPEARCADLLGRIAQGGTVVQRNEVGRRRPHRSDRQQDHGRRRLGQHP